MRTRRTISNVEAHANDLSEFRVATPRSDLFVLRLGSRVPRSPRKQSEKGAALIGAIAKATQKPGVDRQVVFGVPRNRKIFAYSVSPDDVTQIVREDASGKRTLGRLVNGQFKGIRSKAV